MGMGVIVVTGTESDGDGILIQIWSCPKTIISKCLIQSFLGWNPEPTYLSPYLPRSVTYVGNPPSHFLRRYTSN